MAVIDGSYISSTALNKVRSVVNSGHTGDIASTTIYYNPQYINPGGVFVTRLGADILTKITYTRSTKTVKSETSSFTEETDRKTYTTKISIHNKHSFHVEDLVVRDRIPTCDDTRVKDILCHPLSLGTVKDGAYDQVDDDDDGPVVGWEKPVDGKDGKKDGNFEAKSGWTVELLAEYDVEAPLGSSIGRFENIASEVPEPMYQHISIFLITCKIENGSASFVYVWKLCARLRTVANTAVQPRWFGVFRAINSIMSSPRRQAN